MPRTSRKPEESAPVALIASAANVSKVESRKATPTTTDWQRDAWYFYDSIGELRFAANWLGNALSRCNLQVVNGDEPEEDGPASQALNTLFGGPTGQGQMLSQFGVHLTIPGETYLVGENPDDADTDVWAVMSTDEIRNMRGGKWRVDRGDGNARDLSANALVIRLWRSHPRMWIEADSPTRSVLPILREIEQLTKHVAATIDSRLAGAGILLLPSEMSFASPTDGDEAGATTGDPFFDALTEAMMTPIQDRSSAAAVVPIVIKAPGQVLSNAEHLTFSTPFDEQAQSLRTEAIRRLALGMDLPPEIMLGTAGVNHWGAWQVDEAAIKMHVEPLLELIVDALTRWYLAPALEGQGIDPSTYRIGYDTSDLRLRPNRSSQAIELYDRLELNSEALRRETGFEEQDRPNGVELRAMLLKKLAIGVSTSDLTVSALHEIGLPLVPLPSQIEPVPRGSGGVVPSGPQPDPNQTPVTPIDSKREPPGQRAARVDSGLMAACEVLTHRAIERANNKIGRRGKKRSPFSEEQCERGLSDAWTHVDGVAECCDVDPERLRHLMDTYARSLLLTGADHDPALLRETLTLVRPRMKVVP